MDTGKPVTLTDGSLWHPPRKQLKVAHNILKAMGIDAPDSPGPDTDGVVPKGRSAKRARAKALAKARDEDSEPNPRFSTDAEDVVKGILRKGKKARRVSGRSISFRQGSDSEDDEE